MRTHTNLLCTRFSWSEQAQILWTGFLENAEINGLAVGGVTGARWTMIFEWESLVYFFGF